MWSAVAAIENSLADPQKVQHRITVRPRDPTPKYTPENKNSNKNSYTDGHSSIICNH